MNLPSYFNSQLFILAVALICSACGHKPFDKAVREFSDPRILALEKTAPPSPEDFADDLNYKSLPRALESSIQVLKSRPDATLMFGDREISAQHYAEALNNFSTFLQNAADANLSEQTVYKYVIENFDFYQVYGDRAPSQIFMTSYFEPVIEGSLRRTKRFSQPIYSRPADLLELDVAAFDEGLAPPRKYRARVENGKVVPYYSRREIDIDMALAKKKLELLWVDPIDSFIAQIQGSATVVLPSGKQVRINYAERNGHKYEALGKFLKAHIPPEKMSIQAIEAHLRSLPEKELHETLALNPSYIFFVISDKPALTTIGVPAVAGRSVAVDAKLFPKGALAFLRGQKPIFQDDQAVFPERFEAFSRLVVDHDTGGAITGPARLDLFWGSGKDAARHAGVIRHEGNLFYLAPKVAKP